MLSWKVVLACIIVVYLVIASAISIAVRYLAAAPTASTGQQERPDTVAFSIEPGCMFSPHRSWDFSGPDDVPSYGPMRPCDDYEG